MLYARSCLIEICRDATPQSVRLFFSSASKFFTANDNLTKSDQQQWHHRMAWKAIGNEHPFVRMRQPCPANNACKKEGDGVCLMHVFFTAVQAESCSAEIVRKEERSRVYVCVRKWVRLIWRLCTRKSLIDLDGHVRARVWLILTFVWEQMCVWSWRLCRRKSVADCDVCVGEKVSFCVTILF